jgi:hypothetical protein
MQGTLEAAQHTVDQSGSLYGAASSLARYVTHINSSISQGASCSCGCSSWCSRHAGSRGSWCCCCRRRPSCSWVNSRLHLTVPCCRHLGLHLILGPHSGVGVCCGNDVQLVLLGGAPRVTQDATCKGHTAHNIAGNSRRHKRATCMR